MSADTSPRPVLTVAPAASVGSNFVPLLEAITRLCHHASLGHKPERDLADADFDLVSRFLDDAYKAILHEWQALYMDPTLGDRVDTLVPWPEKGHTDLLSLGLAVADQTGQASGPKALLCSALVCSLFTATQSAAFMLFADKILPRLTKSNLSSNLNEKLVAGYCGGAGLAIVLACSQDSKELAHLSLENVRIGFWLGLASDRAAARQRQKAGMPRLVAELQSWALVTMNISMQTLEESIETANSHAEVQQRVYISAHSPNEQYSIMGFPATLTFLETLLRQYIKSKFGSKTSAVGRVARIPIYGPFHSEKMLMEEVEKVQHGIAKRRIFDDTVLATKSVPELRFETLARLYSSIDGRVHIPQRGIAASLLDMIMRSPTRWDKVADSIVDDVKRFLAKHPTATVEVLNIGPGGSLGQSLVGQLQTNNVGATLVDLEDSVAAAGRAVSKSALPPRDAIAIVSTAVRAPGNILSVDAFWDALNSPCKAPEKLPVTRFRIDDYVHEARKQGTSTTMHEGATYGHFLSDIDKFDARLYSISPREAERLDPHHRFLLECAMEAMERAGYAPNAPGSLNAERIATFFAVANDDYRDNGGVDIRSFHLTGNGRAFAAGRVSFLNRWTGPSATIDSGEMSVLSALIAATDALRANKCDTAIVAGAQMILSPTCGIALDRVGILAHTGKHPVAPFSSQVQGAVRGEACGALVLKRLKTALSEEDPVLALLTGLGATFAPVGWMSPYEEHMSEQTRVSQQRMQVKTRVEALETALRRAELARESVGAVECNCSGNVIDESLELEAVSKVFAKSSLYLTTAKSHFGDAEAAAGILSLIKAVEMVRRNEVPPHPGVQEINSVVAGGKHLSMNQSDKSIVLKADSDKRSAVAVQSYSLGGGNSVAIIESAETVLKLQDTRKSNHETVATHFTFCISANTKSALEKRISNLASWLAAQPDARAIDAAYTLACRKIHYPLRLTIQSSTLADASKTLASQTVPQNAAPTADVVVFFSGQGSQYEGMARLLLRTSGAFLQVLTEADTYLMEDGFTPIVDQLSKGEALDDASTQCAIFCVDYAVSQLLKSFHVAPSAFAGHSLGEYCALACSGVLTFRDALFLVASRARLVLKHCKPGAYGMLAVRAGVDACRSVIESTKSSCEVACDNGIEAVTIAGNVTSLSDLREVFEAKGIKATLLQVNFAFHSKAMDAILDELKEVATKVQYSVPHTAIYSNVLGRVVLPGEDVFDADYIVKHARHTVRFREAIAHAQVLRATEATASQKRKGLIPQIAVEAGADAIILSMLRDAKSKDAKFPAFSQFLPCLKKRQNDVDCFVSTLAKLWTAQIAIDWRTVYGELLPGASFLNALPTYPFDDTRFYTSFTDRGLIKPDEEVYVSDPSEVTVRRGGVNMQKGKTTCATNAKQAGFVQMTSLHRGENGTVAHFTVVQDDYFVALARNHRVGETALTPGTLTGVVCQQAASQTLSAVGLDQEAGELFCRAMHLPGPLPMPEQPDRIITVRCTVLPKQAAKDAQTRFSVSCALISEKEGQGNAKTTAIHNEISLETAPMEDVSAEFAALEPILLPTLYKMQAEKDCEVLQRELAYSLFGRCVIYGASYQSMASLRMRPDMGVAVVALGRGHTMSGYTTLPRLPDSLTVDAIGQLPGLMLNLLSSELDDEHVFILDSCGRTAFLPRLKELEEARADVLVLGTARIEPRNEDAKGETYALADTFTFEQTPQGPKLIAIMLGSRYHKMRTRTLLSVLKTVA